MICIILTSTNDVEINRLSTQKQRSHVRFGIQMNSIEESARSCEEDSTTRGKLSHTERRLQLNNFTNLKKKPTNLIINQDINSISYYYCL